MPCLFVRLRISTIAYLMPEWGKPSHPYTQIQEEEKNENYRIVDRFFSLR